MSTKKQKNQIVNPVFLTIHANNQVRDWNNQAMQLAYQPFIIDVLREDLQEHLQIAHDELEIRYLRSFGWLNDDMEIISAGTVSPNFDKVNKIVDVLLSIGIKPYISLTFMPGVLAASSAQWKLGNVSWIAPPREYGDWAELVSKFTKNLQQRYGINEIRRWFFEVWNEPNLDDFWAGSQLEYFKLYKASAKAIKSVDSHLLVGGPATARGEWLNDFIGYCAKNNTPIDFISTHIYNNDSEFAALSPFAGLQLEKQNKSPDFAIRLMTEVCEMLEHLGYNGPVHWNEWGGYWSPKEPRRDSPNHAAWMVCTMGKMQDFGQMFAYCDLSDVNDLLNKPQTLELDGYYGMISSRGLRKPSFWAHYFCSRLKGKRFQVETSDQKGLTSALAVGDLQDNHLELVLYHCVWGNDGLSDYTGDHAQVEITLCGLPLKFTDARIKVTRVDETHNNVTKMYHDLAATEPLTDDKIQSLTAGFKLNSEQSFELPVLEGRTTWTTEVFPGVMHLEIELKKKSGYG